jgi:hypothetical protein
MFSNFLGDRPWPMWPPNCRGPLVFEQTLPNVRYVNDWNLLFEVKSFLQKTLMQWVIPTID